MAKAIALLSGGLDSILATKLILEQGIEIEAVNFLTVFCTYSRGNKSCLVSKIAIEGLGIKLKVFEVSNEYLEIVKNPKYGYGSQINPCLDCRIFMFKKAGEYMREIGAQFLITGEVLGERPMSQRKDAMRIIEKDSGLTGLILRPLSAKLLEPTIPEKRGLVDREKLLSISGRSRKSQIELAKKFKINDYLWPSGGCLLTDPSFAKRMRDLMKYNPNFSLSDVKLLKLGRHFRLSQQAKLIVGRDKQENESLLKLAEPQDICLYPKDIKGPIAIGKGVFNIELIKISARIVAKYCDGSNSMPIEIIYKRISDDFMNSFFCTAFLEEEINTKRI